KVLHETLERHPEIIKHLFYRQTRQHETLLQKITHILRAPFSCQQAPSVDSHILILQPQLPVNNLHQTTFSTPVPAKNTDDLPRFTVQASIPQDTLKPVFQVEITYIKRMHDYN